MTAWRLARTAAIHLPGLRTDRFYGLGNAPVDLGTMDVTIGMHQIAREITLNVDQKPEEVRDTIAAAIEQGQPVITLRDKQGRTVIIPTKALAYAEVGGNESRRVGFGA